MYPYCFLFQLIGDASVAQYVLFEDNLGTYLSVNWSWAIAVAMGVWVSGGVSGKRKIVLKDLSGNQDPGFFHPTYLFPATGLSSRAN